MEVENLLFCESTRVVIVEELIYACEEETYPETITFPVMVELPVIVSRAVEEAQTKSLSEFIVPELFPGIV